MVLEFRGCAHPPPGLSADDAANLSAAEIGLTNLGRKGGAPLLFEHDQRRKIGHCLASWEGKDGELRVAGVVSDPAVERSIRNGSNQGLSLGTDVVQDRSGTALYKEQQELSVCAEPRRPRCYIDTVDGKQVRHRRLFSAGAPLSTAVPGPAISHPQNDTAETSMSDAAATTVDAGDAFSKETVDKLKAELAAKSEEAAKLRAFKNSHDEKQRDAISKLQPEIQTFVDGLIGTHADFAEDMKPIGDWAKSCHQSQSLETAMPLARVLSCASAQFKRTREEASALSGQAESLGSTMKELEEIKADNVAKLQRISELETLCNDRQEAAEKMQEELAKAGVLREKFDFSKLSSREVSAPKGDVKKTDESPGLSAVTSNASRGAGPVDDELMSFVRGAASNIGSHRISQSGTGHSQLGASTGTLEGEIASAFSGM